MGNQVLATAARNAGAKLMFGYPITPSSEILETWAGFCLKDKSLEFLQTEDEMAAGFALIGACLAGIPAFTATAGPGNILMQDALSMAEALRIPTVAFITQRGGLSTSTVIYSQEEVTLTCLGGNGEGFRLVYAPASLQELYDYTLKAFINAWQYRWPTFILADGYQGKMKGEVEINENQANPVKAEPILGPGVNLRNCYNLEEEIGEVIGQYQQEYQQDRTKLEESTSYLLADAQTVIVAHGIVAAAAQQAIDLLRQRGHRVGLFRPITLRPFPATEAHQQLKNKKRIVFIESALGQLARLFKDEVSLPQAELRGIYKPSVGFTPGEICERTTQIT